MGAGQCAALFRRRSVVALLAAACAACVATPAQAAETARRVESLSFETGSDRTVIFATASGPVRNVVWSAHGETPFRVELPGFTTAPGLTPVFNVGTTDVSTVRAFMGQSPGPLRAVLEVALSPGRQATAVVDRVDPRRIVISVFAADAARMPAPPAGAVTTAGAAGPEPPASPPSLPPPVAAAREDAGEARPERASRKKRKQVRPPRSPPDAPNVASDAEPAPPTRPGADSPLPVPQPDRMLEEITWVEEGDTTTLVLLASAPWKDFVVYGTSGSDLTIELAGTACAPGVAPSVRPGARRVVEILVHPPGPGGGPSRVQVRREPGTAASVAADRGDPRRLLVRLVPAAAVDADADIPEVELQALQAVPVAAATPADPGPGSVAAPTAAPAPEPPTPTLLGVTVGETDDGRTAIRVVTSVPVGASVSSAGPRRVALTFAATSASAGWSVLEVGRGGIQELQLDPGLLVPNLASRLVAVLDTDVPLELRRSGALLELVLGSPSPLGARRATSPAPVQPSSAALRPDGRALAPEDRADGEPISISIHDGQVQEIFILLARLSGKNFVIHESVKNRTITLELRDVPIWRVLEMLLTMQNLAKVEEGNVVRILPVPLLLEEAQQRASLNEALNEAVATRTIARTLSHASVRDVDRMLKDIISKRGRVIADTRTNMLIITDLPDVVAEAERTMDLLDRPARQVLIEARIVQTTRNFMKASGIRWGLGYVADRAYGNETGFSFPNSLVADGAINVPAPASTSELGLSLRNILNTFNLDVALMGAEQRGWARVVSRPQMLVLNNEEASIESGVQLPIVTTTAVEVDVTFVSASLKLTVRPQISADDTVIMEIEVANNSPVFIAGLGGNPSISTRQARTVVAVKSGATAVMGGIYEVNEGTSSARTPFLSRLPVVGSAFRNRSVERSTDELLIFLTPRITRE